MKYLLITLIFISSTLCHGQKDDRITTIDFVQIINDNKAEALYYFENNWKVLRKSAIEKGYIHSYQMMETEYSENAPFHLMFITTYVNEEQYKLREENFGELIAEKGELKLMNEKQPGEFRKSVFVKEEVKHL